MKAESNAQVRRDFVLGAKVYKLMENPQLSEADKNDPNTVLLALKDWQDTTNRTHGFFSTMPPEEIFSALTQKMQVAD